MRADEITLIRRCLQMTQAELAILVGAHEMTVSKWERGRLRPTRFQIGLLGVASRAVSVVPDIGLAARAQLVAGPMPALALLFNVVYGRV